MSVNDNCYYGSPRVSVMLPCEIDTCLHIDKPAMPHGSLTQGRLSVDVCINSPVVYMPH